MPAGAILRILQKRSLPAALVLHRSQGPSQRRQLSRLGRQTGLAVQAVYGWPVDGPLKAFIELRNKLRPLATALGVLWEAQRRWLSHTLARTALWVGLLVGAATAAANMWGVPAINQRLLPLATQQAAVMLQREVRGKLGGLRNKYAVCMHESSWRWIVSAEHSRLKHPCVSAVNLVGDIGSWPARHLS